MKNKSLIFCVLFIVIFCTNNLFAQTTPWWWTYPNKLPAGNNFDYIPCMGEGKNETEARRKAEADSYRMFSAKNKNVEFSEITYKEIEENGLVATLTEYAANYTFVCNPDAVKINDNHYKVYILYAWRRDFSKPVNFNETEKNICDSFEELYPESIPPKIYPPARREPKTDYIIISDAKIAVQKKDIVNSEISYADAKLLCESSMVGGYTDWRLPTINELAVLHDKRDFLYKYGGLRVSLDGYWVLAHWSSTKKTKLFQDANEQNQTNNSKKEIVEYRTMQIYDGKMYIHSENSSNYCRCVRSLP